MTQMPSPVQDGVATLKMEANVSLLMQMTTLAVRLTGRGWRLHLSWAKLVRTSSAGGCGRGRRGG